MHQFELDGVIYQEVTPDMVEVYSGWIDDGMLLNPEAVPRCLTSVQAAVDLANWANTNFFAMSVSRNSCPDCFEGAYDFTMRAFRPEWISEVERLATVLDSAEGCLAGSSTTGEPVREHRTDTSAISKVVLGTGVVVTVGLVLWAVFRGKGR